MNTVLDVLCDALPFFALLLLIIGLKQNRLTFMSSALWLSLIALMLHYQNAGGEILGRYFGYRQAGIYSLNLVVLISALLALCFKLPMLQAKRTRYVTGFISALLVVSTLCLLGNLWINARFIETSRPGTPIMQVVPFTHRPYCSYRYIFYKIGLNGKVSYLCPNHYGLIPSVGELDTPPDFITEHLGARP